MLSKEELESRANQIREYVEGNDWLVEEQIKAALENADALEEIISLREQLAELKALEPVAEMRTWPKNISGHNPDWFWFGRQDFPVGTQLFTAAKPAKD
ncbi:hypothetical protein WFJ72_08070 [Yersinia enterocolitica]